MENFKGQPIGLAVFDLKDSIKLSQDETKRADPTFALHGFIALGCHVPGPRLACRCFFRLLAY